jgi:hypothetical protein
MSIAAGAPWFLSKLRRSGIPRRFIESRSVPAGLAHARDR